MKLVDVEEKHEPFDCASGMAAGLLATGNFKQYIPPEKPQRTQDLSLAAKQGTRFEGIWDSPFIVFHCKTCGNTGTMSGPTCHKTQTVRCCGVNTPVPEYIAQEYATLRKEWEPRHKRYVDSVRRAQQEQERIRKAANETENRRLATQLRLQSIPSHELAE
jgi:hypothetical protein